MYTNYEETLLFANLLHQQAASGPSFQRASDSTAIILNYALVLCCILLTLCSSFICSGYGTNYRIKYMWTF